MTFRPSGRPTISSLEDLKRQMEEGQEVIVDQEGKLHLPDDKQVKEQMQQGKQFSTVKPQRWF